MTVKIFRVKAGVASVFIVGQEKDFFLVDAGGRNFGNTVLYAIKAKGLKLANLKFIFLTHTHYDHAGCAAELKNVTGIKIIVHQSEAGFLTQGDHFIPKGTYLLSKLISSMGRSLGKAYSGYPALEPDVVFSDSLSLQPFGFNGKIISTPGHTIGSASLIIDNVAFAGDTLFNFKGFIFPPFANDTETLIKSWGKLLQENAEWYYPAHGKYVSRELLKKEFLKRSRK